jgi:hypothetical protein
MQYFCRHYSRFLTTYPSICNVLGDFFLSWSPLLEGGVCSADVSITTIKLCTIVAANSKIWFPGKLMLFTESSSPSTARHGKIPCRHCNLQWLIDTGHFLFRGKLSWSIICHRTRHQKIGRKFVPTRDPPPGWPDWANFRLLGDSFLWVLFVKITELAQKIGIRFPR